MENIQDTEKSAVETLYETNTTEIGGEKEPEVSILSKFVHRIIDQIVRHGTDPASITINRIFELANRTKLIHDLDPENPILPVVFQG